MIKTCVVFQQNAFYYCENNPNNNFVISQIRKSNAIHKTKYINLYSMESAELSYIYANKTKL